MNLRSVDLNLLVILDALLDEAHVSRAAQRLNLSQPAVSSALQRCRDLFRDPLLERGRGVMYRTAKADALRAPLKSILAGVVDLVDPPEIGLKDLVQVVRITTADDPMSILVGPLVSALRASSPGITIVFQSWQGADAALRDLMDGDTDLAISVFDTQIEDIEMRTLIEEDYVIAMRRDHPAAKDFDLDAWLDWPHAIVSGRGDLGSPLDMVLNAMGRTRNVGVVVPSFQMIPRVLAASDFIAMVPRHSLALYDRADLACFDPPVAVDGFPLHLAWHTRNAKDAGLRHVIGAVESIFDELDPRTRVPQLASVDSGVPLKAGRTIGAE